MKIRRRPADEPEAEKRAHIKDMNGRQKLIYFWMYYKWVPAVAAGAVLLVIFGAGWIRNARTKTILTIAVVDGGFFESEPPEREIKQQLGSENRFEKVNIISNLSTEEDSDRLDYLSQMLFVAQLQSGTLDVVVLPEATAKGLQEEGLFMDLKEAVREEAPDLPEEYLYKESLLVLPPDLFPWFDITYEPVCVGVVKSCPNPDNSLFWIKSLTGKEKSTQNADDNV